MNTYNYRSRNALILMITCVLSLDNYAATPAMSSDAQSRRVPVAQSDSAQPARDAGRLIIRRIPNLGNAVIVDLYVDGVAVAAIGYGKSFDGFLPPGRHIVSVRPTPNPVWPSPVWQATLDVRNGQTYYFTAMGDDSGHLILKGA